MTTRKAPPRPRAKNPAPAVSDPSGVYVRVPMSPELAALVGGHVERATAIVGTVGELLAIAGRCADAVARERVELERTAKRLRSKRSR